MKWRAIETAPKDGTAVLLYSPDSTEPQIFIGHFIEFEGEAGRWQDYWREDGCWPIHAEPTHWMPLPKPPTA
jgi:hypothetical protein